MPSLLLPRFSIQDMSDKKSPPRKEKSFLVRTPQPDDKGMKRKLLSPPSPTHDDDDKKTPNKRKRGSFSVELSPMTNQKTPGGGSRAIPLSERQQLAMIKRMSDESSQEPGVKPPSSPPMLPIKKPILDKKVFKRNTRGEMPIHLAAISGDSKLVKKLIKAGADVNVADFAGWTPLHEASNRGWVIITKQLLKAGANVNVQGLDDDTPLHDAAINGHKKLVELLLKHGANPLQPNAKGKTPLDVASSPEMARILKKETICSASDCSSIEEERSPMSPDSINSYKDDDKSVDLDDLNQNNRLDIFSSSSTHRRHTMPKSPDSKLASPRLCLKFHRDHLGGHANQKSRDSTYSVTNMSQAESCIDNPMFSPVDSPASSVDSDLYNPHLDHLTNFSGSRVKITIPEDENSMGLDLKQNLLIPPRDVDRNDTSVTKEVFPDQEICDSENRNVSVPIPFPSLMCTSSESQEAKSVLKPMETLPFKPNSQFSFTHNDEDSMELPDLEIDTSDSIPSREVVNQSLTNSHADCNSVSSSSVNETSQSLQNHSNVSSTTEPLLQRAPVNQPQVTANEPQTLPQSSEDLSQSDSHTNNAVSESFSSHSESSNYVTNTNIVTEASSSSVVTSMNTKWDLQTSVSPENDADSVKSDSEKPCSPNRTERDSQDSRPSTPKVPPLKIIIPPKSQPSSTAPDTNEGLKLVVSNVKSALPYVINPYQQHQGNEAEAQVASSSSETWSFNHLHSSVSATQNPVVTVSQSHSAYGSNSLELNRCSPASDNSGNYSVNKSGNRSSVKGDNDSAEMEIDELSVTASNGDIKAQHSEKYMDTGGDSGSNSSKCDTDSKREDQDKKEEPTQRVLRSAVRSQQLSSTDSNKPPKQQKTSQDKSDKSEKSDKSNGADSSAMSPSEQQSTPLPASIKPTKEDEDLTIPPRKRKLKRPELPHPPSLDEGESLESTLTNNNTVDKDKVPNPYEIYLRLRKQISTRRRGYLDMLNICPKTPQGFKDYLLKTCNYVLQGNNTSTLSVPTLSPPNSVKDKMRDLFVQQEEARYKLRLQHLIEREKLILSIEQEILREHSRWARAIANQSTPLSACSILRDEEIYNFSEDQVRLEEKDKKNRTRFNGRQFLSWIQDVDDKYEKIKEFLILRQKQEADSLYAYQKLEWEWRLKELALCERNVTPDIDELHVPLVNVHDNFDLRPT